MMFERGVLSPQCRPGPHAAHPSGRRFRRLAALAGLLTLASSLLAAAAPAVSAATGAGHAKKTDGWIQLTHLSPNTPPVDVYLYSFGDAKAMLVLKHVAYGTVSPFEKLTSGEYTVAMRGAGAKPGSPPVLSTTVNVAAGGAYTVAGLGPAKALRLQVLRDRLTTPKGESLVRVIQASLHDHKVTVTAGSQVLARQLAFGNVTSYATARPGTWMVHVSGAAGTATKSVTLTAGTIHTLVVLDGAGGSLMIDNLVDAAGSGDRPAGRRGDGPGRHRTGPGALTGAVGGRDRGRGARHRRRGVLAAPGQAPGPSRTVGTDGSRPAGIACPPARAQRAGVTPRRARAPLALAPVAARRRRPCSAVACSPSAAAPAASCC